MFTNKDKDYSHYILWLPIWVILVIVNTILLIKRGRNMYALCHVFTGTAVALKILDLLLPSISKHKIPSIINWGLLVIGIILLFLQIGYEDEYKHSPYFNVSMILIGCMFTLLINRKKRINNP